MREKRGKREEASCPQDVLKMPLAEMLEAIDVSAEILKI